MSVRPEQFLQQIAAQPLASAYLIVGAEQLQLLEASDAVRARARALGIDEREVLEVDGRFDWNTLAQAAANLSLFSSRRLIELRLPAAGPGADGGKVLSQWCEDPPGDIVLLVTCPDWSKRLQGAWSAALGRIGPLVECWPVKPEEMPRWVAARLKSRGLKPVGEVISLLAERNEGNLLAAAQEIDLLALLLGGGELDEQRLQQMLADNARFDPFRLTDVLFQGDAERALRMLRGLAAEGTELPMLMGWLANQVQVLLGLAEAKAAGRLEQALREGRIYPARQALYRRALERTSARGWAILLMECSHLDRIVKGQAAGNAWLELERLLLRMALGASARRALRDRHTVLASG